MPLDKMYDNFVLQILIKMCFVILVRNKILLNILIIKKGKRAISYLHNPS